HCAPPGNKPTPDELGRCADYLTATIDAMPALRVAVTLGGIAHGALMREYRRRGWVATLGAAPFAHGAEHFTGDGSPAPAVVCCYHPSQQNTFTGRLTPAMLEAVLRRARQLADRP